VTLSSLVLLAGLTLAAPALSAPAAPSGLDTDTAQASPRRGGPRPAPRGVPYGPREDVQRFADDLAERRGLDREWLRRYLAEAQMLPVVRQLMLPAPSATAKNWRVYRSRFIDPIRIAAGVKFWQAQREALERAEKDFGVPPEIVVGIIGVETIYGQQMGNFRVIDALATLAFDFPPEHPRAAERSQYFRGELEQFLALHAAAGSSPLTARGSYAGAMGMPQFMPTSHARWAIDYDGDQRIDLARSAVDVVGSVANYFKGYGWIPGMPTHYPVSFDRSRLDLDGLLAPDILPTFSAASFQARGAVLEGAALDHKGPLALVELQNGPDAPQYVAGTENFYVITRYNWSSYYAMAVIELGREVREALERQDLARRTP
jgi:membrane-bound lytic murein transglycosylase B